MTFANLLGTVAQALKKSLKDGVLTGTITWLAIETLLLPLWTSEEVDSLEILSSTQFSKNWALSKRETP